MFKIVNFAVLNEAPPLTQLHFPVKKEMSDARIVSYDNIRTKLRYK